MNDIIQVRCPLYLLRSTEPCWRCDLPQSVVALGTHSLLDDGEGVGDPDDRLALILLSNIEAMPDAVLEYITQRNPRYVKQYSRTADSTYYANSCDCGANFGDFYLFSEPGGAFFPLSEEEASRITYHRMPFVGELPFQCSFSQGPGDHILAHGREETA